MTARRSTTSHIRCLKHPGPYLYRLYSLRFPLLPTDFTPPQTANWLRTGRFQRRLRPSREPGSPRNATRQVRSISWYGKRGWWPVIVHLCRCGASARARGSAGARSGHLFHAPGGACHMWTRPGLKSLRKGRTPSQCMNAWGWTLSEQSRYHSCTTPRGRLGCVSLSASCAGCMRPRLMQSSS